MLSEQFRLAGIEWAKLDAAANLLEESKSAVLQQMIGKLLQATGMTAYNRAEMGAKASPEWAEYIKEMVKARENANLAKINVEAIKMQHWEEQNASANNRAEMRL